MRHKELVYGTRSLVYEKKFWIRRLKEPVNILFHDDFLFLDVHPFHDETFTGIEWFPDDDDSKWQTAVHLWQCGRVLGSLNGKFPLLKYSWRSHEDVTSNQDSEEDQKNTLSTCVTEDQNMQSLQAMLETLLFLDKVS